MHVASLVPAATETLFALDVPPVAVSHACDYPPAAQSRPVIDRTHVDSEASAAEIDEQVAEAFEARGSPFEIDTETLAAVDPDCLITQGVCEVCAVSDSHVREALAAADIQADLLTTHPHTFAEVLTSIEEIGARVDATERATALVDRIRGRFERVNAAVNGRDRPTVLVLDWTDPPMVAGHWVPDLVRRAGGEPVLASPGEPSGAVSWEQVQVADPDVILVAPCGFGVSRAEQALDALRERPGWETLGAVQAGHVHALDGSALVNRPGPRLAETLDVFAELIHPTAFDKAPMEYVRRRVAYPADTQ
ncbi:MAG: cobalamin-binding protein [Halobacteriaceae archaeon]